MINLYLVWKKGHDPRCEGACSRELLASTINAAKRHYACRDSIKGLQAKLLLRDYEQSRKDDEAVMDRIEALL